MVLESSLHIVHCNTCCCMRKEYSLCGQCAACIAIGTDKALLCPADPHGTIFAAVMAIVCGVLVTLK